MSGYRDNTLRPKGPALNEAPPAPWWHLRRRLRLLWRRLRSGPAGRMRARRDYHAALLAFEVEHERARTDTLTAADIDRKLVSRRIGGRLVRAPRTMPGEKRRGR